MRLVAMIIFFLPVAVFSQAVTAAQQKALNDYIAYANETVDKLSAVAVSVIKYYPSIRQHREGRNRMAPRYTCPLQLEAYYYNQAIAGSKALGATFSAAMNPRLEALKAAVENVDGVCKALDTYHKLEDYKRDSLAAAEEMIRRLPALLQTCQNARAGLLKEAGAVYAKLNGRNTQSAYHQAARIMMEQILREQAFLDTWNYNLEETVHTGWPVENLEAGILETAAGYKRLSTSKPAVKYPASAMYTSFVEGLASLLERKRAALDGYNAEARKSDKHGNDVYLGLINYFNGTLVSFYNNFIQYAQQDGFYGLKAVEYPVLFSIRNTPLTVPVSVVPYRDISLPPLNVAPFTRPVQRREAVALNNYADLVNECVRQSDLMQRSIGNFSTSASRYRGLTSFQGKGGLQFKPVDFKIPLSLYQLAVSESAVLKPEHARPLNVQAEVLISVLQEMEQLSQVLALETTEKRYEQDGLDNIYRIFERYKELFGVFDDKKEQLYGNVRQVYDAWPVADPGRSWIVSWRALRTLADHDHEALFAAKHYYQGSATRLPDTQAIDRQLRDVISSEYDNMKGIEKLGRYNGRCPYTPYEDIPKTSRSLSEKLQKIGEARPAYGRHPYHDLVYLYNDVVDDYNKFCELSGLDLLKTVRQPEFFEIKYPEGEQAAGRPAPGPIHIPEEVQQADEPVAHNETRREAQTKVVHDTVYIEKRDTVYLGSPDDDLRSMEGYATNNMILLLDVSGSMNVPEKLPLLKQSVLNLLAMMRAEDQVSIVVYSGKAKVLLQPTSFKDEAKVRKAINSLKSSGRTDGNAGIKLAYQVADKNYIRGGNNRIILATDGEFPIGTEVFDMVEKFSKEDIFLSVFNFGRGNSSARNLEKLAGAGHGNYEHITSENMELKLIREAKAKRKR